MRERGNDANPSHGLRPPAFRLPEATRVGAVRLQVASLSQSIEFYRRVLGFGVYSTTPEAAALGPPGETRPLVRLQTASGVRAARRGAFGLYHFAVLLPDRAALGQFAAHVLALGIRAGMADHLVSEAFYLSDPDGLGIEVYADRPRSAWQRHGAELVMTTDPLDVASVVGAGAGGTWTGAPAGTTIGHVHLHVGDLGLAEAYYHRALGFDKTVWSYPGALFFAAGGYHHHLGTNTWSPGPSPPEDEARLLEWELLVPAAGDVAAAGGSLRAAGFEANETAEGIITADPWGTPVRIRERD